MLINADPATSKTLPILPANGDENRGELNSERDCHRIAPRVAQEELRRAPSTVFATAVKQITLTQTRQLPGISIFVDENRKSREAYHSLANGQRKTTKVVDCGGNDDGEQQKTCDPQLARLAFPIELYSERDTTQDLFGTVGDGDTIPLAISLLFSLSGDVYLKPVNNKYEVSFDSLCWHSFEHSRRQAVRCEDDSAEGQFSGIYIDSVVHEEIIVDEEDDQTMRVYHVHLYPPLLALPEETNLAIEHIQANVKMTEEVRPFARYPWKTVTLEPSTRSCIFLDMLTNAVCVWEPIIEPVENEKGEFEIWRLSMTIKSRNKKDYRYFPQSEMKIEADKVLDVIVTESLLSLLKKLFRTPCSPLPSNKSTCRFLLKK